MHQLQKLLVEHIDLWTAAFSDKGVRRGRVSATDRSAYGVSKLRDLILQLAASGRLVAQDPCDQDAKDLLKQFELTTKGEPKNKKNDLVHSLRLEKNLPFDLPGNWKWVYLPEIAKYGVGKTPSTKASEYWSEAENAGFNWVSIADLNDGGIVHSTTKKISQKASTDIFKSPPIPAGTLLMSFKLTLGKTSILDVPAYHNEAIISIFPNDCVLKEYLLRILPARARAGNSKSAIKGNTLNSESLASLTIPLPPLAEQARIVAKINELMLLCDSLESKSIASTFAHSRLVEEFLSILIQSKNDTEFYDAWKKILNCFDILFTTEDSIYSLKAALIQLGIMGRLVPQDPKEGTSTAILENIQCNFRGVSKKKLEKLESLSSINPDEQILRLPQGWCWAKFPELGEFGRGKSKHRPRNDPSLFTPGIYPLVQTGEVARANNVIDEYHSKYSEMGLAQSKLWPAGTLCITIAANIADAAILGFDACFPDSVVGFIPSKPFVDARYFLYYMKTAREDLLKFAPATAQKNINLEILESLAIPLPPPAEINRIVEKIESLMSICDSLIAQIRQASELQRQLADVLVEQALA